MIEITGYTQVKYSEFQKTLNSSFSQSRKTGVQIAAQTHVRSAGTIKNALNKEAQMVSDEVLTAVMKVIGVEGFVNWFCGKRYYYLKSK